MEQDALYFGENCIIKSVFHKNKKPINIDEVDVDKYINLLVNYKEILKKYSEIWN